MQTILKTIEKASRDFMFGHVTINHQKIKDFKLDNVEKINGYFAPPTYLQSLLETLEKNEAYKIIHIYNAINASLQYSFFMGNAQIRFDGIDSFWVMRMLDDVFKKLEVTSVTDIYRTKDEIIHALIDSNITLLESRIRTLEEVFSRVNFYEYGDNYLEVNSSMKILKKLICFKQDIFFKKGLFAIMITGRMLPEFKELSESYKNDLTSLPVPADYQIPKMLRHYGLIEFSKELSELVDDNVTMRENSEMELNIRAATVQACELLSEMNGVSMDDVDAWLFMCRKDSNSRHHLCVTESY